MIVAANTGWAKLERASSDTDVGCAITIASKHVGVIGKQARDMFTVGGRADRRDGFHIGTLSSCRKDCGAGTAVADKQGSERSPLCIESGATIGSAMLSNHKFNHAGII